MSEEKQAGYVVCYDTHGGGLTEPSWGIHVCWGEGELQDEVSQVFNEIVSVQPMTMPVSSIFYVDYKFVGEEK